MESLKWGSVLALFFIGAIASFVGSVVSVTQGGFLPWLPLAFWLWFIGYFLWFYVRMWFGFDENFDRHGRRRPWPPLLGGEDR